MDWPADIASGDWPDRADESIDDAGAGAVVDEYVDDWL